MVGLEAEKSGEKYEPIERLGGIWLGRVTKMCELGWTQKV